MPVLKPYVHAVVWSRRLLGHRHAPPELAVIAPHLARDAVCIDVGAHGGSWTYPLARRVPAGHVYAFEALPYYADVLRKVMRVLRCRNVTVLNEAVCDAPRDVEIVWRDGAGEHLTGLTHIGAPGEDVSQAVSVPGTTLDALLPELGDRRVDLLKVDVEGAELMVFRGAALLLESHRPLVYAELCRDWCARYDYEPDDVFALFAERDYRPFRVADGRRHPLDPAAYVGAAGEDVLFMPAERAAG